MSSISNELIDFIKGCPSVFHSVASISKELENNGFTFLKESDPWSFKEGKFFTTRNGSSIIAFEIPKDISDYHFQMVASHGDSPCYKVKACGEIDGPGEYLRLDVESYGSMIDYTWLDKPLGIAGRVYVKHGSEIEVKLVNIVRDVLIIPSLAIHQNRDVNKGYEFNRAVDLCPLFSAGMLKKGDFLKMVAENIEESADDIVSADLFLVNHQEGKVWGYKDEFVSSPKLDDLMAAFTSLKGFEASEGDGFIKMFICFDNEEVGSGTKQGAMSTFLRDVTERINDCLGKSKEQYKAAVAKSFMVSFDNAHAVHPNQPQKCDPVNSCRMNGGIVIKENAAQHYTTDAFSRAVFKSICERAGVPTQVFANRSDTAGGGTLGNISNVQLSVNCVDIGLAQLAMHSSFETAGALDGEYAVKAIKEFYSVDIKTDGCSKFSF